MCACLIENERGGEQETRDRERETGRERERSYGMRVKVKVKPSTFNLSNCDKGCL